MKNYKVTVCRFGYARVEADSEREARQKAQTMQPDQIHWLGKKEKMQPFLVTYAEKTEDRCEENRRRSLLK